MSEGKSVHRALRSSRTGARGRIGAGRRWANLLALFCLQTCLLTSSCENSESVLAASPLEPTALSFEGSGRSGDFLVRIVTAEGGQPLAGAVVHWLSPTLQRSTDFGLQRARGLDAESSITSVARRFESDERGELRLPLVVGEHSFIVRHGKRFGVRMLDGREEEPFVVPIARERRVDVRVVDAAGEPVADAFVGVHASGEELGGTSLVTRTDARGLASMGPLEFFSDVAQREYGLSLSAGSALPAPPASQIDPQAWPRERRELVLPPTAALELSLVDAAGRLNGLAGQVIVGVMAAPADPAQDQAVADARISFAETRLSQKGRVRFEHVAAGVELLLCALPPGDLHVSQRRIPAIAPGVVARHRLRLLGDSARLRAQLVDVFGEPLSRQVVTWDLRGWSSLEAKNRGTGITDEDGWLELVGQHKSHAPIHFDALSLRMPEASPPRAAELELGGIQLGRAVDLGAIEMEPLDFLLAGRVLDEDRRPIRRALVHHEARARGGTWFDGEALTWPTGSDGRFELYGEHGDLQSLRVIASKPGSLPKAPVVTRIGRRELVLRLEPAASLELRLEGLAGLEEEDLYELDLALMTAREVLAPDERPEARIARWDQLGSGKYTLRMQVRGEAQPFARIVGLEVVAGEPLQDPRISPYDLTGQLWAFDLRAYDAQGQPLDSVEWRTEHSDVGARYFRGGAEQRVLSSRKVIEAWAHAEGFRDVHLRRVISSRRVVMHPGIEVEVALLGEVDVAPGVRLVGGLTRAGAAGSGAPMGRMHFEATGTGQLALGAPGRYEVTVGLLDDASEVFLSFAGYDEHVLAEIEVLDVPGPQRFEIQLDSRLVEMARLELRRDD